MGKTRRAGFSKKRRRGGRKTMKRRGGMCKKGYSHPKKRRRSNKKTTKRRGKKRSGGWPWDWNRQGHAPTPVMRFHP